ncbi:MAG: response regulator [Treponema sp.]|nr:response regulator [Treponema sp.]
MKKIRVLIMGDSSVVCSMLSRELSAYREISAEGISCNPYSARDKIKEDEIDVLLLDIDMRNMNGLALLKSITKLTLVPVIVMSSLITSGDQTVVQALELGAVDAACKPGGPFPVKETVGDLYRKIQGASAVSVWKFYKTAHRLNDFFRNKKNAEPVKLLNPAADNSFVVIGTSTGGVLALEELFSGFSSVFPPVFVVTHMPPGVTASLAGRLDRLYAFHVKEAQDGENPVKGTVYLSPGWSTMLVDRSDTGTVIRIKNRYAAGNNECHTADMLFMSAAESAGKNCIAVLLTGTGVDGAAGMKAVHDAGGWTIVQDKRTCIVYDMPGTAVTLGVVSEILPINEIAERIEKKTTSG